MRDENASKLRNPPKLRSPCSAVRLSSTPRCSHSRAACIQGLQVDCSIARELWVDDTFPCTQISRKGGELDGLVPWYVSGDSVKIARVAAHHVLLLSSRPAAYTHGVHSHSHDISICLVHAPHETSTVIPPHYLLQLYLPLFFCHARSLSH